MHEASSFIDSTHTIRITIIDKSRMCPVCHDRALARINPWLHGIGEHVVILFIMDLMDLDAKIAERLGKISFRRARHGVYDNLQVRSAYGLGIHKGLECLYIRRDDIDHTGFILQSQGLRSD